MSLCGRVNIVGAASSCVRMSQFIRRGLKATRLKRVGGAAGRRWQTRWWWQPSQTAAEVSGPAGRCWLGISSGYLFSLQTLMKACRSEVPSTWRGLQRKLNADVEGFFRQIVLADCDISPFQQVFQHARTGGRAYRGWQVAQGHAGRPSLARWT